MDTNKQKERGIMKHLVIAISREYGSGGRRIGEAVSKKLGISYYDKVLLQLAAERSGLAPEFLEKSEEEASGSFLYHLSTATLGTNFFYQYDMGVGDKAFFAQTAIIQELADKESCVIIGRCGENILRERERCLKVFLYAPEEARIESLITEYSITEKEAHERIHRIDKGRSNYYRYYTGEHWGRPHAHDLCINTASAGIDGAVDLIVSMAKGM